MVAKDAAMAEHISYTITHDILLNKISLNIIVIRYQLNKCIINMLCYVILNYNHSSYAMADRMAESRLEVTVRYTGVTGAPTKTSETFVLPRDCADLRPIFDVTPLSARYVRNDDTM